MTVGSIGYASEVAVIAYLHFMQLSLRGRACLLLYACIVQIMRKGHRIVSRLYEMTGDLFS